MSPSASKKNIYNTKLTNVISCYVRVIRNPVDPVFYTSPVVLGQTPRHLALTTAYPSGKIDIHSMMSVILAYLVHDDIYLGEPERIKYCFWLVTAIVLPAPDVAKRRSSLRCMYAEEFLSGRHNSLLAACASASGIISKAKRMLCIDRVSYLYPTRTKCILLRAYLIADVYVHASNDGVDPGISGFILQCGLNKMNISI